MQFYILVLHLSTSDIILVYMLYAGLLLVSVSSATRSMQLMQQVGQLQRV